MELSSLIQHILTYLETQPTSKKFWDLLLVMAVSSWLLIGWVVYSQGPELISTISKLREPIDVNRAVALNAEIDSELGTLRAQLHTDRVSLSRFHNGKVAVDSLHFIYASDSNEADAPGVASTLHIRQSVLLSFLRFMPELVKGNCAEFTAPESDMAGCFKEVGDRSAIVCPILNGQANISGFVTVASTTDPIPADSIPADERLIKESALRLSGLLSLNTPR